MKSIFVFSFMMVGLFSHGPIQAQSEKTNSSALANPQGPLVNSVLISNIPHIVVEVIETSLEKARSKCAEEVDKAKVKIVAKGFKVFNVDECKEFETLPGTAQVPSKYVWLAGLQFIK